MINLNPNVTSVPQNINLQKSPFTESQKPNGFDKTIDAIKQQISKVDQLQTEADSSVVNLLTGKNQDITSVVSSVAKADMSFKLLLGVRNKLIDAYKQTMNMGI
ncbi:MAG: flagellar hook-basal body complex protein FliE [Phycisphaerae bacterium]